MSLPLLSFLMLRKWQLIDADCSTLLEQYSPILYFSLKNPPKTDALSSYVPSSLHSSDFQVKRDISLQANKWLSFSLRFLKRRGFLHATSEWWQDEELPRLFSAKGWLLRASWSGSFSLLKGHVSLFLDAG